VQCESCHGPAGDWLHAHDRAGFSRATRGFIDTKNLSERAGACMPCHVGPNDAAGNQQVVDHDLIAAGHPRLTFEFHAYFESLPAHWDRAADQARHPGDFHFRSWLAGQTRQAEQQTRLNQTQPRDFARFDCFACHHALSGESSTRERAASGPLKPVDWLRAPLPPLQERETPAAARLELIRVLLEQFAGGEASWDAATQAYLATRAVSRDFTVAAYPRAKPEIASLDAALDQLGQYLSSECFAAADRGGRPPTQYDSPTQFDRRRLAEPVQAVSKALQQLEAAMTAR